MLLFVLRLVRLSVLESTKTLTLLYTSEMCVPYYVLVFL